MGGAGEDLVCMLSGDYFQALKLKKKKLAYKSDSKRDGKVNIASR